MRRTLIILAAVAVIAALLFGGACCLTSQTHLTADRTDGRLALVPLTYDPLTIEIAPGISFKLDTGADMSTITESDLALLAKMGYTARKTIYPAIGRDGRGDLKLELSRITVDLPLATYRFTADSLGHISHRRDSRTLNVLHNVDFAPASTDYSVLGIDFLEKFGVEYLFAIDAIGFYLNIPEGYEACAPLSTSMAPWKSLWLGSRYYVPITVHNRTEQFFLDTGVRTAFVKMPPLEVDQQTDGLEKTTVSSARGTFPALKDADGWVTIGQRAGHVPLHYYYSEEEDYAVNPFNLYDQDVLLDFKNKTLCLRPYYSLGMSQLQHY